MSIAREVKQTFDIDRIAEVAERLGYTVQRNVECYGYYRTPMHNGRKFDVVIKGQSGRFDIGFTEETMVHDEHGGYTLQTLKKVLPEYYREAIELNGYTVDEVVEAGDEIVIKVNA